VISYSEQKERYTNKKESVDGRMKELEIETRRKIFDV